MHRLIKLIFWTILFLATLLAIDRFFVLVSPIHPAHEVVTKFYKDFRGRLIDLTFGEVKSEPESVEAVIEKQQNSEAKDAGAAGTKPESSLRSTSPEQTQRYIYSDNMGELHFADSIEEVPDKYRGQAQPMGK